MLEGNRSDDQYYRRRQRPVDPTALQTTTEPPQRHQHRRTPVPCQRQQKEGNEILFSNTFLRSLGGSFSAMTQASDTSARLQFKEVETAPFIGLRKVRGKEARQGNG